jgi:hypothetical protein
LVSNVGCSTLNARLNEIEEEDEMEKEEEEEEL